MDSIKKKVIMDCQNYEEIIDIEYGKPGSMSREAFETEAEAFCLAELLKEKRKEAGLTQQQLAEKIGTKRSDISKIENGHTNIQLSTLFRVFNGLGKKITLQIL